MTVKFRVVPRGKPGDPAAPKKYYPSIQSSGRTSLRELAQEIGRMSTVSSVDTLAVLEALLMIIPGELARGNIVDLGDFGSFRLRTRSEGADSPGQVTARHITQVLPRFQPGKEFKRVLSQTEFEKTT